MDRIFTPNIPIDETRISFIERVVERVARRSRKVTSALLTPYPISNAVIGEDIKGTVLRYMFPCEGTITKGMVHLGTRLKGGAKLTVYLFDNIKEYSGSFAIEKQDLIIEPNISVRAGDCLDVSVFPSDQEKISEIWISFLWVPTMKDIEVMSFLIDELEKVTTEIASGEQNALDKTTG